MRQRQAAKVGPVEFRSGVAETISRVWNEYCSGACFLSRIDPKLDRAADEKTCSRQILFRGIRLSSAPRRHDCVNRRGDFGTHQAALAEVFSEGDRKSGISIAEVDLAVGAA
jgi:hypothetical protein